MYRLVSPVSFLGAYARGRQRVIVATIIRTECLKCNEPTKKIGRLITHNNQDVEGYREYDKTCYRYESDDVPVEVEVPVAK